jgi:hypothetical protein
VITDEFLERETLEIDMIPMLGRNTVQKKLKMLLKEW